MNQYWQNLNERERRLVAAGAAVTLLYLFYVLLFAPLTNALSRKTAELQDKQDTLQWLQQVKSFASTASKSRATISESKLLSLIAAQLNRPPLKSYPYQLQQTGNNEIQISFEQVPFNHCIRWLWGIMSRYKVSLKQISATQTATPGVTRLTVMLQV